MNYKTSTALAAVIAGGIAALASTAVIAASETKHHWEQQACNSKKTCRIAFDADAKAGTIVNVSCNFSSSDPPSSSIYPTAVVLGTWNNTTKKFTDGAYIAPVSLLSYSPTGKYQVMATTVFPVAANTQPSIRIDFNGQTDIAMFCSVSGNFLI